MIFRLSFKESETLIVGHIHDIPGADTGGGGGGVLGVRPPPTPHPFLGGTPKLHKEGKKHCARVHEWPTF